MNNAQGKRSRSVSQGRNEVYSDLTEGESTSIDVSGKNEGTRSRKMRIKKKPRSYHNQTSGTQSTSLKFRKQKGAHDRMSSRLPAEDNENENDNSEYYEEYSAREREQSRFQPEYEEFSEEEYDGEELCAVHHKELDMVCLEQKCEIPVCSKCILVGDHKNHSYLEKEKFFKNLETQRKKLMGLRLDIGNCEKRLSLDNSNEIISNKLEEQRQRIETEIRAHCAKAMQVIEDKRTELERETRIYFETMGEKLQLYVKETLDVSQCNQEWKKSLDDVLQELGEQGNDIESGFGFMKQNARCEFEQNGGRLLDNLTELQTVIDNKAGECLTAFTLIKNEINLDFMKVERGEISFKQDLRERMQLFMKSTNPALQRANSSGFGNNPEEFQNMAGHRDTDLLKDDFDPFGSNLMADLDPYPKQNTNTRPNFAGQNNVNNAYGYGQNELGHDQRQMGNMGNMPNMPNMGNPGGMNNMSGNLNPANNMGGMNPLSARGNLTHGNNLGHQMNIMNNRGRQFAHKMNGSMYIEEDDQKFYSQSSANNFVPSDFRVNNPVRDRSRSRNAQHKSKKNLNLRKKSNKELPINNGRFCLLLSENYPYKGYLLIHGI